MIKKGLKKIKCKCGFHTKRIASVKKDGIEKGLLSMSSSYKLAAFCEDCGEYCSISRFPYTKKGFNHLYSEEYITTNADMFNWSIFLFIEKFYSEDFKKRFYKQLKDSYKIYEIRNHYKKPWSKKIYRK